MIIIIIIIIVDLYNAFRSEDTEAHAIYGHYHGDRVCYSQIPANDGHLSHFCQTRTPFQIFCPQTQHRTDTGPSQAMPVVNNYRFPLDSLPCRLFTLAEP